MSRVKGRDVAVTPLTTQPGDIWPGPLPPPTTLQDLERESPTGVEAPVPGSPLESRGKFSLTAPLPNGTPGAPASQVAARLAPPLVLVSRRISGSSCRMATVPAP